VSVIAEFTIDASEFSLGTVLASGPEMRIELERIVPTSGHVMPFFWATGSEFGEFERVVRESPLIEDVTALDRVEDRVLYRAEWAEDIRSLVYGIAESDATILEASGDERWVFRLRFADHGGLSDFHNYCTDQGINYHLERVYTLTEDQSGSYRLHLTEEQREAIVLAVERGYFDVPRGVTLVELAEELDVSQQAVSERVRRATGDVLQTVLLGVSGNDL